MQDVYGVNSVRTPAIPRFPRYLHSKSKRCLDLTVCVLVIIPATIVMCFVALAVIICDGWPMIIMQPRVGRGGIIFRMPKVRTMKKGCGPVESRVTCLGRILRKHRLDELPQLFLVLTGQMSLVGPRPELVEKAADHTPRHECRLVGKPGLTGLWQVNAARDRAIHEDIGYDLFYLRRASLGLDVRILLKTICFVIRPRTLGT